MSHRGRWRGWAALVIVALLGAATAGCDDSDRSPIDDPTSSFEGSPPSDRDSYQVSEIDLTEPSGAPTTAADRLLRVGGRYVLLGHDATEPEAVAAEQDGSVWTSPDLTTWEARGGWIAGYAGVQRLIGLVESDGAWVGAYNEHPSGLPPLAWHVSTPDAGLNWHEDTLPAPKSQPSTASGVVSVDGRIIVTGTRTDGEIDSPVVWRSRDGKEWTMRELESAETRSVAPNQPFRIGHRVLIPGASLKYQGDEIVASTPLLWSTNDRGATYKQLELPKIGKRSIPLFGLHGPDVDLIFGWSGEDAVVWRSTDDGMTWRARPESTMANPAEGHTYPRRAVRDGDCNVLAGVIGDPNADEPLPAAMWRSCDAGMSWSRMATDELEEADATDTVDLVGDSDGLVLVTNSAEGNVRLLRLQR